MALHLRHSTPLWVAIALILSTTTAVAQDNVLAEEEIAEEARADDDGEITQAQEAFERGAGHYFEGEYGQAIVQFRRAYQIHPHGIFMYNIARSNLNLGQKERALDAALRADGHASDLPPETLATNRALIASLQADLRAQRIAQRVAAARPDEIDEPPTVGEAPSRWGGKGWAGVGALGLGVVGLTGAAVIDQQILSEIDDAGEQGLTQTQIDDLSGQQTTGQILLFSGAGLAAVGASLIVWELVSGPDDGDRLTHISPRLDRPGINVMFRW